MTPSNGPPVTADEVIYTAPPNYDTFVQWWKDLEAQYPNYLQVWSPNQAYGLGQIPSSSAHPPYDLYYVRLTNESLGFHKPEVFFMGNPHGDERTGVIGAYWFVHWLLRHALTDTWNTPYDEWLNWILDNREVYFGVSHNPDGFDRIRRGDAFLRDLNRETDHDGPQPDTGWNTVFESVQGKTVVRFMNEHQVRVGADFHGGIRALLFPWGSTRASVQGVSPVTGVPWSYAPPDFDYFDVFGHRMGDYIGDFGGNYSAGGVGTPPGIVGYVAQGTYLNWAYGSDTAANPAEAPYVDNGPYRGSGALWFSPEMSNTKNPPPSQYGGDLTLGWGIDVRRTILAMIDIAQPYVRWHPSGLRDGAAVQAGDYVTLAWQVNGSLVVDSTYVQWGTNPDPIRNPTYSTRTQDDFAGQRWGGTGWERALDGATQGYVWRETVRVPPTPGTYYFAARAKVDGRYSQVLAPGTYGSNTYLRLVKERTWTGWSEDLSGADGLEHMESRTWWDSPVLQITVVPDTTPPVITLVSPPDSSLIRAGTILNFQVADGTLVGVTASVDGAAPVALPPPWDLSTTGWADGTHTVRLEATDQGGLTTTADFSFTLDSTPPTITLLSPATGSTLAAGSIIDLDVADPHLSAATWSIGDAPAPLAAPYDLSTAGWPEGPATLTITARDTPGNENTRAYGFTIDVAPPRVQLLSPPADSVIRAGTVLDFDVADVSAVIATWDDGSGPRPLAAPYDVSTAGWGEGAVSITLTATDAVGRTSTVTFPFTIDNTPPVLRLVTPSDGAVVRPGTVVDLEAADAHLGAVVWNAGFGPATLGPPYDVTTTGWADGTYAITVRATDAAGNEAFLAFALIIDGTPPSLARAEAGTIVQPGYHLIFSVSDPHLGPVFWIADGSEEPLGVPYHVNTAGWADGDHLIRIRATDEAGNEATVSAVITIDGTPPVVNPYGFTGDAVLVRPGLRLQFVVVDDRLSDVVLLVDGTAAPLAPPYEIDTTRWEDGVHAVEVRASDRAGNVGTARLAVTIDGTPPSLNSPTVAAARVGTPVTVRVSAEDLHGIKSVTLHWRIAESAYTDTPMTRESGSTYVAELPPPTAAGTLEVSVTALDQLGNRAETAVERVEVSPRPVSASPLAAWTIGVSAAVIVAAVLAVVALRRRSSRQRGP